MFSNMMDEEMPVIYLPATSDIPIETEDKNYIMSSEDNTDKEDLPKYAYYIMETRQRCL